MKRTFILSFVVLLAGQESIACSSDQLSSVEYDGHSGNVFQCALWLGGPDIYCRNNSSGGYLLKPLAKSNLYSTKEPDENGLKYKWVHTFELDPVTCTFLPGESQYYDGNGVMTIDKPDSLGEPVKIGAADRAPSADQVRQNQMLNSCVESYVRQLEATIGREDDFNKTIFAETRRDARATCAKN